jgi:NAD-dependent SIR2 family protein deacetylase
MCWQHDCVHDGAFTLTFLPIKNKVEVIIDIDEKMYNSLPIEIKPLFKITPGGYRYQYLNISLSGFSSDEGAQPCPNDQKLTGFGTATPISGSEVANIIKTQNVIFYTGAGISACCVPAMAPLEQELGLTAMKKSHNSCEFMVNILKNVSHYVEIMKKFFYSCEHATPSVAHEALAKIVKKYRRPLYTENIDKLHQKTRLKPVVMPGRQREALAETVKSAQYIITIGLSTDDGGFLKYCKQINPSIRIISINQENTCYLSDKDFTLIGDIQEVIPKLLTLL